MIFPGNKSRRLYEIVGNIGQVMVCDQNAGRSESYMQTCRLVEEMVQKACLSISDARFPFDELSKEAERILLATKNFTPGWTHAVFATDHLFGFYNDGLKLHLFCDVYTGDIHRKPCICRNCFNDFPFLWKGQVRDSRCFWCRNRSKWIR